MLKMPTALLVILCILAIAGGAQGTERIQRVETGLPIMEIGEQGPVQTENLATIEDRLVYYKVPGVSIAIIDNYQIAWSKSYGMLNNNGKTPATTSSVYQAGSVSKMITAAIVLHYVDEGVLALDRDVNEYMKSWQIPASEFTRGKPVTLRNILSHRSGLPSTNFSYDAEIGLPSIVQILRGEIPALNEPAVVGFVPESKYQYSNIGYVVVQQILEEVVGKPLAQIAQEVICEPLGMTRTTFNHPLPVEWQADEALPHSNEGKTLVPAQKSLARAQGGLMASAEDLAKFAVEIMKTTSGKSNLIFGQDMARQQLNGLAQVGPRDFGGIPFRVGLGSYVLDEHQDLSFMHLGVSYPGSEAVVVGFPSRGQGAVIMVNADNNTLLMLEILASLVNEYGWPSGDYCNPAKHGN